MKEFLKITIMGIIVAMFFIGAQLVSNYVHYGTFIFK